MMSTISRKFASHVFVCLRLCHCLCHFLLITLIICLGGHKYPKSLIEGVLWMHLSLSLSSFVIFLSNQIRKILWKICGKIINKKNDRSCNWGKKQQILLDDTYMCFFSGDANFLCHAREKLMQTPSPTVCSPQTLINNIVFTVFLVLLQIFMCSYLTRPPHVMYSCRPCLLSDNHRRHTTASAH